MKDQTTSSDGSRGKDQPIKANHLVSRLARVQTTCVTRVPFNQTRPPHTTIIKTICDQNLSIIAGQRHTHFLTEVENRDLVVPGAVGTEGISLVDHASDQTRMASLKEQIVRLIGASLGESGLFRWGFPDVDVLEILDSILQSANVKPFTVADIDKSLVNTMYPKDPLKSKFVAYRRKIYASKVNVKLLLLLCFKSDDWTEQDWDKKPIDAVLAEINSSTDPKSEASR